MDVAVVIGRRNDHIEVVSLITARIHFTRGRHWLQIHGKGSACVTSERHTQVQVGCSEHSRYWIVIVIHQRSVLSLMPQPNLMKISSCSVGFEQRYKAQNVVGVGRQVSLGELGGKVRRWPQIQRQGDIRRSKGSRALALMLVIERAHRFCGGSSIR